AQPRSQLHICRLRVCSPLLRAFDFFFQAEDGIRDATVTGVQTCALPIFAIALMSEPCASTVAAIRPSTISEKYSAGPNFSATSASGGANSAMITVDTQPAKNEPIAAMPSAGPARPWRAIWYPSRQVTTEDDSPGMLTRIAVVDPPYWAP